MELRYQIGTRYVLLALLGLIFTSISCLIYLYNPSEIIEVKMTEFSPDSLVYKMWKDPPFELQIKIYVFNVTNTEEFLDGKEKLRVQEVGPYTYRESVYNINTTFNDNGTLTFIPKRRLEFIRNESIGDVFVDRCILPNLALLGLTSYLHESSMFTNLAFSSLTSYLKTPQFVNITIDEFLLGYDEPLVALANDFVPNWIDFSRIGILDRIMALDNSSELVTMNIKREPDYSIFTKEKNVLPFAIEAWDGSPGLPQWGYKGVEENDTENLKCNTVEGAVMGTLFPQNMDTTQTIRMYRRAFCRTIPFVYDKPGVTKDGFEVNLLKVDPKYLLRKDNNTENSCYCQKRNPDDCPPNGMQNMSPCYYGIPIALSPPHFLDTDPSVSEKIEGLFPDEKKHKNSFAIHKKLGIPLEVHLRAQINLIIPDTRYNYKTEPFNNHVVPLLWIDLAVEDVPEDIKYYLRLLYHTIPVIQEILMYVFGSVGVFLLCYSSISAVFVVSKLSDNGSFKFRYSTIPVFVLRRKPLKLDGLT